MRDGLKSIGKKGSKTEDFKGLNCSESYNFAAGSHKSGSAFTASEASASAKLFDEPMFLSKEQVDPITDEVLMVAILQSILDLLKVWRME